MIKAGATRIGTSSGVKLMNIEEKEEKECNCNHEKHNCKCNHEHKHHECKCKNKGEEE